MTEQTDTPPVAGETTDLVTRLAAADEAWSQEVGDQVSAPDYIRWLAGHLTAERDAETTDLRDRLASTARTAGDLRDVITAKDAENTALHAEVAGLKAAIQDIDAHATPIGLMSNNDPDGNPHHYALTVGALHRALGKAGTAPKCSQQYERAQALQAENDQLRAQLKTTEDLLAANTTALGRHEAALDIATTALGRAEFIVSDDYGRGGGSDLPSWDADQAAEILSTGQTTVAAVLADPAPEVAVETPEPDDDPDPAYCPSALSGDDRHSSDYLKRGWACQWCGAEPDEADPAPSTPEGDQAP